MNLEVQVREWTSAQDIISSVPEVSKLNVDTAKSIAEGYSKTIMNLIELAKANAELPYISSEDDFDGMQRAGDLRKQFKKIRTEANNIRETLKKDSLQYGKAVQAVYNQIEDKSKTIEAYLQEQETYAERIAKQRMEELDAKRRAAIPNNLFGYMIANMNYGEISEQQFQALLSAAQGQYDTYVAEQKRKIISDRYAVADSISQFMSSIDYENIAIATHDEWVSIYSKAIDKQKKLVEELEYERAQKARLEKEREALERKNAMLNAVVRNAPTPVSAPFIEEEYPFDEYDSLPDIVQTSNIDITIFELENDPKYQFEIRVEQDGIRLESRITRAELQFIYEHIGAMLS